jgi:hypothetical protein
MLKVMFAIMASCSKYIIVCRYYGNTFFVD